MKNVNINNYIGNILKQCRIESGLTQEQAAEAVGIAPRYLSQLERGFSKGSLDTIIKFCDFFNITPNTLIGGLLQNHDSCDTENFNNDYNSLNSNNKDIINNLIAYLLKVQKNTK